MMLLCTELAATKAAIEARLLAGNPIQQRKRIPTSSPLPHQRPGIQAEERPQPRRGPIPSPTSQVRLRWTAARQMEPVSSNGVLALDVGPRQATTGSS